LIGCHRCFRSLGGVDDFALPIALAAFTAAIPMTENVAADCGRPPMNYFRRGVVALQEKSTVGFLLAGH
jgi:hypothetical protein